MFASTLSAVAILLLPLVQAANSCVSVDANFNLLAFNLAGKDYNAGPKDQWSSGTPQFTGSPTLNSTMSQAQQPHSPLLADRKFTE